MNTKPKIKSFPIRKTTYLLVGFFVLAILSCNSKKNEPKESKKASDAILKERLMDVNSLLTVSEDQEIEDFIARYRWQMQSAGSGLRYQIYHSGNGKKAQKGMLAQIAYKVILINGVEIYNSQKDGIREVLIGRGESESGLHEGLLLMHQGDKARLILPSHLAHGFPGDGNLIPKRATVIYDIELLNIKFP